MKLFISSDEYKDFIKEREILEYLKLNLDNRTFLKLQSIDH